MSARKEDLFPDYDEEYRYNYFLVDQEVVDALQIDDQQLTEEQRILEDQLSSAADAVEEQQFLDDVLSSAADAVDAVDAVDEIKELKESEELEDGRRSPGTRKAQEALYRHYLRLSNAELKKMIDSKKTQLEKADITKSAERPFQITKGKKFKTKSCKRTAIKYDQYDSDSDCYSDTETNEGWEISAEGLKEDKHKLMVELFPLSEEFSERIITGRKNNPAKLRSCRKSIL